MNKLRPWLEGTGLSLLYLVPFAAVLLSPTGRSIYHQLLPVTTLMRGLLLDIVVLSVLGGLYFLALKRRSGYARDLLALPLFLVLGWFLSRDIDFSTRAPRLKAIFGPVELYLRWLPLILLVFALLLLWLAPRLYRQMLAATTVVLAAAGIATVFVVVPRLVLHCFSRQTPETYEFRHPVTNAASAVKAPRIIWVLFDELSYNQVFEHRATGLDLPAFDKLASVSTYYSHLVPAGLHTELVIPGLFIGQQYSDFRVGVQGNLFWRTSPQLPWNAYDAQKTIFADAQRNGWSTGLAGWYNPYCRLLAPVLNRCLWDVDYGLLDGLFAHLSSGQSSLTNALYAMPFAFPAALEWINKSPTDDHRKDYEELLAGGESLIRDPAIRFAFIHLPIPHPPIVYTRPGPPHQPGYLDNLALSDIALAHLRDTIASTPDAARTLLIVSSDHSWRTQIWHFDPDWTDEDQRVSNGAVFDDRPVLMVHFPGQTQSDRIDGATNLMAIHGLLEQLIQGNLSGEAGLNQYLGQQAAH